MLCLLVGPHSWTVVKLGAGRESLRCVWWHVKCAECCRFSLFWSWCVVAQLVTSPGREAVMGEGLFGESSADQPFTGSLVAALQI